MSQGRVLYSIHCRRVLTSQKPRSEPTMAMLFSWQGTQKLRSSSQYQRTATVNQRSATDFRDQVSPLCPCGGRSSSGLRFDRQVAARRIAVCPPRVLFPCIGVKLGTKCRVDRIFAGRGEASQITTALHFAQVGVWRSNVRVLCVALCSIGRIHRIFGRRVHRMKATIVRRSNACDTSSIRRREIAELGPIRLLHLRFSRRHHGTRSATQSDSPKRPASTGLERSSR